MTIIEYRQKILTFVSKYSQDATTEFAALRGEHQEDGWDGEDTGCASPQVCRPHPRGVGAPAFCPLPHRAERLLPHADGERGGCDAEWHESSM